MKGKQEKSPLAMKNSLDYSSRALAIAPSQIHFKFNIAFVQIQLAQLMHSLPESQRTLAEVQAASEGLDDAIESFTQIAHSKNPPYPKHDIEQRANMGRNTMRHQLERAVQSQKRYEEKNAAKLQEAREARDAELRKREEARKIAAAVAEEQKRKIAEERHKMLQVSRELAEKRLEEERRKEEAEYTEDEETGERVKRKKVKRGGEKKKKGDETDTDGESGGRKRRDKNSDDEDSAAGVSGDDAARPPKRRRKLARKNQGSKDDKFKSSELVVDSDSDGKEESAQVNGNRDATNETAAGNDAAEPDEDVNLHDAANDEDDDDDEEAITHQPRKPISRRIAPDDDDDEDDDENDEDIAPNTNAEENGVSAKEASPAQAEEAEGDAEAEAEASKANPKRNVFADPPDLDMADASVTAAGDQDAAEY